MDSLFKVGVIYSFVDRISGPVMRVISNVAAMDEKFKAAGATIAKVAAGASALAVAGGIVGYGLLRQADAAGDFQKQLTATGDIASATGADLARLHDKAMLLGVITEYSPLEVVQGMRNLASVGLNVGETLESIQPVLNYSFANMLNLADGADTITAALKGFNWEVKRAEEMGDMLTKLTNISAFRGGEMKTAVAGVASIATAANQSARDVLALMGIIRSTGETAEGAADHTRMAITAIMQPSIISMRWAKKAGFDLMSTYRDAAGNILPITEVFANIEKNTRHLAKAERDLLIGHLLGIGGLQAYQKAMMAVYTDSASGQIYHGLAAVDAMSRGLNHAHGTTDVFAAHQRATWDGVKKMLHGTIETYQVAIGETLLPLLSKLVSGFTGALNKVLEFMQAHQRLFAVLIPGAAVFAAVAVAAGGLAIAFIGATWAAARLSVALKGASTQLPLMLNGLRAATAAVWEWVAASWGAFSVRGVFSGIAAAVGGVADLFANALVSGVFMGSAMGLFVALLPVIAAVGVGLYKLIGGWEGIKTYAAAAWEKIVEAAAPLVDLIKRDFPAAYSFFAALIEEPMANISAAWKAAQYAAGYFIGATIRAFGWLMTGISMVATGIYMAVFHPFEAIKNLLSTGADLYESGKMLVLTFVDGIKSVIGAPFETVEAMLAKVRQLLPFSDAKEGPLSKLTYSGGSIMGTMAEGVRRAAPHLRATVAAGLAVAAPVVPAMAAPRAIPPAAAHVAAQPAIKAVMPVIPTMEAPRTIPPTAAHIAARPAVKPVKPVSIEKIVRESRTTETAKGESKQTVIHVHIGNLQFEDMNAFMEFLKAQGGGAA